MRDDARKATFFFMWMLAVTIVLAELMVGSIEGTGPDVSPDTLVFAWAGAAALGLIVLFYLPGRRSRTGDDPVTRA